MTVLQLPPVDELRWREPYLEHPQTIAPQFGDLSQTAHLLTLWRWKLDELVIGRDPDGSPLLDSHRRVPTEHAGWALHLPYEQNPLSGNSRDHFRVKAQKVRTVRETAFYLCRQIPPQRRIRVRLDWEVIDRRDRDEDNVVPCMKALVDGIRLAGVVPKDTREYVLREMPMINYAPRSSARPRAHMRLWLYPDPVK